MNRMDDTNADHEPKSDATDRGGNLTTGSLRRSESGPKPNPRRPNPFFRYDQRVGSNDDWHMQLAIKVWSLLDYRWWSRSLDWNPHTRNRRGSTAPSAQFNAQSIRLVLSRIDCSTLSC